MVALLADTTCHGNGLRSPASVLQGMYATEIPNNYGNTLVFGENAKTAIATTSGCTSGEKLWAIRAFHACSSTGGFVGGLSFGLGFEGTCSSTGGRSDGAGGRYNMPCRFSQDV